MILIDKKNDVCPHHINIRHADEEFAETYPFYLLRLDALPINLQRNEIDMNTQQVFKGKIVKGRYLTLVEDTQDLNGSTLYSLRPLKPKFENFVFQESIIFINVHLQEEGPGQYRLSRATHQQIIASLNGNIDDEEENAYGQF